MLLPRRTVSLAAGRRRACCGEGSWAESPGGWCPHRESLSRCLATLSPRCLSSSHAGCCCAVCSRGAPAAATGRWLPQGPGARGAAARAQPCAGGSPPACCAHPQPLGPAAWIWGWRTAHWPHGGAGMPLQQSLWPRLPPGPATRRSWWHCRRRRQRWERTGRRWRRPRSWCTAAWVAWMCVSRTPAPWAACRLRRRGWLSPGGRRRRRRVRVGLPGRRMGGRRHRRRCLPAIGRHPCGPVSRSCGAQPHGRMRGAAAWRPGRRPPPRRCLGWCSGSPAAETGRPLGRRTPHAALPHLESETQARPGEEMEGSVRWG